MEFFYRFEHLALIPGNKSAGFWFYLKPSAFLEIAQMKTDEVRRERIRQDAFDRILRAQLMPKRSLRHMGIGYWQDTLLPKVFTVDPMFGGSVGCDPEAFSRIDRPDALQWLLPEVQYSPHNMDVPKHALALALLVQTWCEAVSGALVLKAYERQSEEAAS